MSVLKLIAVLYAKAFEDIADIKLPPCNVYASADIDTTCRPRKNREDEGEEGTMRQAMKIWFTSASAIV
jgi:hypothetical protein